MCGIAGFISPRLLGNRNALESAARKMADAIAHRGPDSAGVWCDPEAGIALSHRRLAIIDLTAAGAQPMVSADGRWVISYNGEVYNAASIAREPELASVAFRGTSDTEVILESIARRGLNPTLLDLNGIYAIAIWDRAERTLHLARDRLGVKPLFYMRDGEATGFASELKSFGALEGVHLEIEPSSVASYLRFGYVPTPWSIFKNISKVMPGELVSVGPDNQVRRSCYWSLTEIALTGLANPFHGSDEDAEATLHDLLMDAVSGQMISDVPLGGLLSGGIDSSTIVALMVAANRGPVRTFSIGFPEFNFDESKHAAAVARHLGTEHTDLMLSGADALNVIPKLSEIYDEPFADSSQIPTYLVSKLARGHVTVALSGDGGDELFAGYSRYAQGERLLSILSTLPLGVRHAASAALKGLYFGAEKSASLFGSQMMRGKFADRWEKLIDIMPSDRDALYLWIMSYCRQPARYIPESREHPLTLNQYPDITGQADFTARMQLLDTATYLPDDILQKVDRASMAVALEVRPPILDHRVVELAWRLPRKFHVRDGQTKWLLRKVADRYIPREMLERPKMGFIVPMADWLRGPLREWAGDLLTSESLGGGYLDRKAVRDLWAGHTDFHRNAANELWTLLMFEDWRRRWA